jgi:glycosyltransferase involved in cell wall biosynthesis
MKILFQSRVDLFTVRGGDTTQIENTKNSIEKLFPNIRIDISTDIKAYNIEDYDIVHLFNLDWVCETYVQAQWAKIHHKPIVLSAIHHSQSEVELYESAFRYDIRRIYNGLIGLQSMRDEWKNIYRSIFNHKKIFPTLVQLIKGIRNSQKATLYLADAVVVQTYVEKQDIQKDFLVDLKTFYKVVNGVNVQLFDSVTNKLFIKTLEEKYNTKIVGKKIILNVGRIEPRKNQTSLIKAFVNLQKKQLIGDSILIFIGAFSKYSPEYKLLFKKLISENKNILHIGQQPQEIVASAMKNDGIYVHPSWFETTGLVALEASLLGKRVVTCGERVREYMQNEAFYCEPDKIFTIENAIIKALEAGDVSAEFMNKIRSMYSWDEAARQTIEIYNSILKGNQQNDKLNLK